MDRAIATLLAVALIAVAPRPASAQVQGQWTTSGSLVTAREYQTQVRLANGDALAIGGIDGSGNVLASVEVFKPSTKSWTSTGSLATARYETPAVVLANGKVLVAGGLGAAGAVEGDAELYDPSTGAWTSAGNLWVPRYAHTATLIGNGKVLVAGGCTATSCSTQTAASELYDPTSNSWSTTGSLATPRYEHTAAKLGNGKVLVVGGIAGSVTGSAEIYDPATAAWSAAASMHAARSQHTMTVLADGKVLVTGGVVTRFPLNSAELYDPVANSWTATGNMTNPRYGHTVTLLGDGTVVVAGGIGQSISCGKACTGYIPTPRAELFTESSASFAATTSLGRAHAFHAATLVGNGQALVAGGEGYTATCCVVLADAGFYTPLTMSFSPASVNFGLEQTGQQSAPATVTVSNVSTHPANIASIASSGDFVQANDCPASLAAGQACTVTLNFDPTVSGTRKGNLTLKDDDPGSPSQAIALSGIGETLALGFQPGSLGFGGVAVGSSLQKGATLTNDGTAPVTIAGIALSTGGTTWTQTNDCPATLVVQQTCTVQITFTPPDVFTYKSTLTVTNGAGSPATLKVSGQGLDGGGG